MSIISYFKTKNVEFNDMLTDDVYHEYIHPTYIDDKIHYKYKRYKYVNHIDNWFNTPVYNQFGCINNDSYESESIEDDNNDGIDDGINHFLVNLHNTYYNNIDTDIENTAIVKNGFNKCYKNKICEKQNTLYNRDVCSKIYNDILEIILDSGYNMIDINQFKEDIIYFIYRLSKLK
jgi:hypothetical protein